ncbi:MAG: transcription elongation factor GreA [Epsilonproteobacteria bacterium]|nr:transcription elongation factor GreA [Campylobacterota bacterium]
MDKEPMLRSTFEMLSKELEQLKSEERAKIAKAIDQARELGDLKENAEYHAAKEKQGLMEARISELTDLIGRANIIDPKSLPHMRVSFGSTVELIDLDDDSSVTYTIVGSQESDPTKGFISISSPMGRALIGKEEGDDIRINLPSGIKEFEIEAIYCMREE